MSKITDVAHVFRVALVVWPANEPRPTPESISQIEFCDASRGKILKFGERSESDGMVCGLALITKSNKTSYGEKAYFSREQVGQVLNMEFCNTSYITLFIYRPSFTERAWPVRISFTFSRKVTKSSLLSRRFPKNQRWTSSRRDSVSL